jgi:hypothetical protein
MFKAPASLALTASLFLLGISASASASIRSERSLSSTHSDWPIAQISPAVRLERAVRIRDTAAQAGMYNAVLLAGIGQVETGFAHCWSEATWACQGPASSSCGGDPVIAGRYDGPCSLEEGGLGMFQFDSGTFTQTINTYGPDIVTMEGNVSAVVPFLVTRAIQSIEGVNSEQEALDWMNSIPIVAGDPLFEEWIYFVSWRYNGCRGCSVQMGKYRDGTLLLQDEMGADFWSSSSEELCGPIPADGATIEEDDDCYRAAGPSQFWRNESAGHGGALQWTKATDNDTPSNVGTWRLRFAEAGNYELLVFSDGGIFGTSKQAGYEILHAEGTDMVVIDQSATEGWISLGLFAFDTTEGYEVRLADNTGEPWAEEPGGVKVMYDALRIAPESEGTTEEPTPPPLPTTEEEEATGSFCRISTTGPMGAWPLLLVLIALRGRRRSTLVRKRTV